METKKPAAAPDEKLIDEARKGDGKAFMELVKRYEPQVAATVIGMLGQGPEAEDVGQEVFIRFYRSLDKFRGESGLGTYLTRIAINLSLNELKRQKKTRRLFEDKSADELDDLPDKKNGGSLEDLDKEIVRNAVKNLEAKFRSVVVLRLLNGYSTKQTAEILKVPVGTVLSRLARAQEKLRDTLLPYRGELL
jgi:RNA polymerase sigma-70 factor (ECF subfamily)